MPVMMALDAIKGSYGTAFCTFFDSRLGAKVKKPVFSLKKFDARAQVTNAPFTVIGSRVQQHKPSTIAFSGSATAVYGAFPALDDYLELYLKTGLVEPLEFVMTNEDPASSMGIRSVALYRVLPNSFPITRLDDTADILYHDFDFVFDDFEVIRRFDEPTSYVEY